MDADGQRLGCKRIANEPTALVEAVTEFGTEAEVVIEATYGWYWPSTCCATKACTSTLHTRPATTGASVG